MSELNFQEAEKFIRENPKRADALAFEYQQFLKNHPEISLTDLPQPILDGKAISEAYYYLREQHENHQMQTNGQIDAASVPLELAMLTVLATGFFQRPKIMQDDKDYQKIEDRLGRDWLKKNKAKDFLSKEGVDYLYGSLDENAKTSLRKEAEEIFRNNPKFKKRIERYDREKKKIYKNREDDPEWQLYQRDIQAETDDRLALLEKRTSKTTALKIPKEEFEKYQQEISEQVEKKHHEEFIRKNPEKRKAYLKNIAEDAEEKKAKLTEYSEGLMGETGAPEEEIRVAMGEQSTGEPRAISASPPTLSQTEPVRSPPFGNPSRGKINQGINSVNKLVRGGLNNPFGKISSKAAAQAGSRLAVFLGSPAGWITIALVLIVVFTLITMNSAGAPPADGGIPPAETGNQTTNSVPTETVTPTIEVTPTTETTPAEEPTPSPAEP